jgi:GDPmannose 4,6-dehydratase
MRRYTSRCGILFNHESPRRGETFVTKKIARGIARIFAKFIRDSILSKNGGGINWSN